MTFGEVARFVGIVFLFAVIAPDNNIHILRFH